MHTRTHTTLTHAMHPHTPYTQTESKEVSMTGVMMANISVYLATTLRSAIDNTGTQGVAVTRRG